MGYKSKYLLKMGDKGWEMKGYEFAKIISKAKEQKDNNDFWKYSWIPIVIAFALVVIILLPK
mgnify:CR=1 FL=1